MSKAQCPHCGAEYDVDGVSTICSQCLNALPKAAGEPAGEPAPPVSEPPPAQAPAPTPVEATPASQRRPCIKCGEPLYTTEMTCWKCGASQIGAAQAPPPAAGPPPPVAVPPPPGPYATPPPSPYAGSQFMYGPNPEVAKQANLALTLGIISLASFLCCGALGGMVLGPIAIWLGHSARKQGAEGPATAGFICGIIATALAVVMLAVLVGLFATGFFNSAAGTSTGPTP